MTNAERKRRHLASSDICASYHSEAETIVHVLRDCPKARQVWESVVEPAKISNFFSLPFPDWLLQYVLSGGSFGSSDERWAAQFTTICWLIWKQHCNADFDNTSSNGIAWVRYGNQLVDGFSATHDRGNIIGRSNNNSANTLPVDDLLELMNRSWKVQLRHISRIQNVVADKLAALSRDEDMGEIVWVNPPEKVLDALHHDMIGIPV
ncbi:hypothetical protein V6N13_076504 [Hibiscus sabdariffa]